MTREKEYVVDGNMSGVTGATLRPQDNSERTCDPSERYRHIEPSATCGRHIIDYIQFYEAGLLKLWSIIRVTQ